MKRVAFFALLLPIAAPQDPEALVEQLRAEDITVRERAFAELEKLGAGAEPELRKAAADPDPYISRRVGSLLKAIELNRTLSPVLKADFPEIVTRLSRGQPEEWTRAYLAVAQASPDMRGYMSGGTLSRGELEPLAAHAIRNACSAGDRVAACEAAAEWFHISAIPECVRLLRDSEVSVRKAAHSALIALQGRRALSTFLEELKDHPALLVESLHTFDARTAYEAQGRLLDLLRHSEDQVVLGSMGILRELDVRNFIPELRKLLASGSSQVKIEVLERLSDLNAREFVTEVRPLLDHPEAAVRAAVAEFLWEFEAQVPNAAVLRILEENKAERYLTYKVLSSMPKSAGRDPAVLNAVRNLLTGSDLNVAARALGAMIRIQDPHLEESCVAILGHGPVGLQKEAMEALVSLRTPHALAAVVAALQDPAQDSHFRCAALLKLAESKALPPLEQLVTLLKGKDVMVAAEVAGHLATSQPDLVREEIPRLLLDQQSRYTGGLWEHAGLIEPSKLGPLLLKLVEESEIAPWYVSRLITQNKVKIVPELRILLSRESTVLQRSVIGILKDVEAVEARPELVKLLSSSDVQVRSEAVRALQEIGLGSAMEAVRELTRDPEERVRWGAVGALRRHNAKDAIPDFLKMLDDKSDGLAEVAAQALVEVGNRDMVPKMVEWLSHRRNRWRMEAAAHILVLAQPAAAETGILAMLDDRDSEVRALGAWNVQMFGLKQFARRLLPLLAEHRTADSAVDAIIVLNARELIPDLENLLSAACCVRRMGALQALIGLKSLESAPRLRLLLDDSDLAIRLQAATGLGILKDRVAVPQLVSMLRDSHRSLRSAATMALGAIGDPCASEALIQRLENSGGDSRASTIRAISDLRAVEAIPDLLRILRERIECSEEIVEALSELGSKDAVTHLIGLLEDGVQDKKAARALGKLGATEAMPAIRRRMEREGRDDYVAMAAALADLGDSSALVKALADDKLKRVAALQLCRRGDRRGFSVLLSEAEVTWRIPPELNAVRSPEVWKSLKEGKVAGRLRGSRVRVLDCIAAAAGVPIRWDSTRDFEEAIWRFGWHSGGWMHGAGPLLDELIDATTPRSYTSGRGRRTPPFSFILERDAIRILPSELAVEFWKQWWADEQAKKK